MKMPRTTENRLQKLPGYAFDPNDVHTGGDDGGKLPCKTPPASQILCAMTIWFFALLLFTSTIQASDADEWQLALGQEQAKVYTKQVAGSPYLKVKAEMYLDADLDRVVAQLGDGDECVKWRKMCKSNRVVEQISIDERIVYTVLDLPWPLSDRDVVNRVTMIRNAKTGSVIVRMVSDSKVPPNDKYVRAVSSGRIEITPVSANNTQLTFITHVDLGGDLPAGRINERLPRGTLDDLITLKALVESW